MDGIQQKIKYIGDYGCYLLCLLKATDKLDNRHVIDYYDEFVNKGYIDRECTILKPAEIMYALTQEKYTCEWSKSIDPNATFIVAKWFNKRTGHAHFVLMDSHNNVMYDPLGYSVTVREGKVDSYRLYYRR